ncbi:YkvA family protein [Methanosphaerula palustris]|uniref:DUF1232 domain-containing protein n=1 Tax=Methanosphaerula palustris (strain ATCC BAA-1556 / DSM 19958 / E1-9c) TaxID=521011 RepID=B8GHW4_METPE|nr:DUF1232 domain-containing protein [Methanosphaerula palustris]ACL16704.1 protein of unknown function DUF1232 [Methanosphaerula palustris E1-9c]
MSECNPEIDELIDLILSNPFLKKTGDEISARALMKWINHHWRCDPLEKKDESKILETIKNLHYDGAISYKTIDNRVLLIAEDPFFKLQINRKKLKSGEIQILQIVNNCNTPNEESPITEEKPSFVDEYQNKHSFEYYDVLIQNLKKYEGSNKKILMNCPIFFKLLCDILNDKFTDWHTKMMISSAIAYFVLEKDVIPDQEEDGYIDDLFIVSSVLKEIKESSPELIDENWLYEEDIFATIDDVYLQTSEILGDLTYDVLRKVGLHKFNSLNLEEYSGSYPQKLSRIASEKRELLGIVVFLLNKLHDKKMKITTVEQIKNILQKCGESDEINRLIELSKINHKYYVGMRKDDEEDFEDILERRLKEARLNALLGK